MNTSYDKFIRTTDAVSYTHLDVYKRQMADREPNMVLIEGIRGAKSMIKIEKPLIVYEKPGIYTSEIYDIYGY